MGHSEHKLTGKFVVLNRVLRLSESRVRFGLFDPVSKRLDGWPSLYSEDLRLGIILHNWIRMGIGLSV